MNPGVYYDLPESVYRADPAVSQSALKVIQRSPAHYHAGLDPEADEREDSDALLLGRVAGTLVLEPHRQPWWVVKPDGMSFATKEGKQWKAAHAGQIIVSFAIDRKAEFLAQALKRCPKPEVQEVLSSAQRREVSVFADVETDSGVVRCKARIDLLCGGNVLADLKTTQDSRPELFVKSVKKYGYDIQAASYLLLWNLVAPQDPKEIFLFLACEKNHPFEATVCRLDRLSLQAAESRYRDLLALYARCRAADQWPGYEPGIHTISTVL